MFELFKFLHILGAIVAFGFGFYAPIYGKMAASEPQHANWFLRASKLVSDYVIIPVAISLFITGTLMLTQRGGMERFQELWLGLGLVLYVIALLIVFLVQRPTVKKVIALTSAPPGPDGPSPEVPGLIKKMQLSGVILLLLVVAIVALMVWKPGL